MAVPNGEQAPRELLEAQAHIWNQLFNFMNSFSLKCAVQLGIPDIVHKHGKPITISELVDALPINKARANCVPRLMRMLVHSGFFTMAKVSENEQEEGYLLTPPSRLLLKDEPLSVTPFLLAQLDPIMVTPWHFLSEWFIDDRRTTSFETAHGRPFWDYAGHEPKLNLLFNEAMASDARLVTSVVIRDCPQVFEGLNSLVDVGGGTGTVAKAIADAYQNMQCLVLDLPHVVDGLQGTNNLTFVGGDMFDYIPPADAVLLKWILHDWSDEECVNILKKCKEAIPGKDKGGKVIIIDMIIGNVEGEDGAMTSQLFFDMLMMVHVQGKERNEKEWAKLFVEAGFTDYKVTAMLKSRSLIEVFP